jgi:MIP family channel proteins
LSAAPSISRKLAAEAVGTFLFVLVGAGSALGVAALGITSLTNPNVGAVLLIAAFANGVGLAVAVSATLNISGGVLNPAVAIALLVGRKLSVRDTAFYIIAELLGAIGAGLALVASFPSAWGMVSNWGSPTLSSALSVSQGIAIEALLTFVLVIVVYGTAVDPRAPKIGGLGIGLAVVADVLVGGMLTGAAMNPARAYGPMIAGGFYPSYWYIYLAGPVLGGIVAGLVYHYVLEPQN